MAGKWKMDFTEGSQKSHSLPNPVGYVTSLTDVGESGAVKKHEVDPELKQKKVWELAQSPLKNVGMMAFMMWMAGNTIQVFSIGVTFTGIFQPIKAIMGSGPLFARFSDAKTETALPRLQYCAIQFGGFLFALYKLNAMGLMPTHTSDWISSLAVPQAMEYSYGGSPLM